MNRTTVPKPEWKTDFRKLARRYFHLADWIIQFTVPEKSAPVAAEPIIYKCGISVALSSIGVLMLGLVVLNPTTTNAANALAKVKSSSSPPVVSPTPVVRATGLVLPSKNELRKKVRVSVPFRFGAAQTTATTFSLRGHLPPPLDQGKGTNSCVGWAVGYGLMNVLWNRPITAPLSPEYLYHYCLIAENLPDNSPIKFETAFSVLQQWGICERSVMTDYGILSNTALANAQTYRARLKTRPLKNEDQENTIKQLLKEYKKPLPVGLEVDRNFLENKFSIVNNRPLWREYGDGRFQHAVLLIGWDDKVGAYELMNSYGPTWGAGGYIWIDYDQFDRAAVVIYDWDFVPPGLDATFSGSKKAKSYGQSLPADNAAAPQTPGIKAEFYCHLITGDANGKLKISTLSFNLDVDRIRAGQIQPNTVLTATRTVPLSLEPLVRSEPVKSEPAAKLQAGDKFKVSEFKSFTLPSGETEYWLGGSVVRGN